MPKLENPARAALVVLAGAASSRAQPCLWTPLVAGPVSASECVYSPTLQRVLCVEGRTDAVSHVRIWSWDGAAWTVLDDSGPEPRYSPGVAYDAARSRVIMFGGIGGSSNNTLFRDTWEWGGAGWVQRSSTGPSARYGAAMSFDESRGRTVLFGGSGNTTQTQYLGDTWEWDGHDWSSRATGGPAPRQFGSMAYDPVRARTMLCGGWGYTWTADLWEWDGVAWAQRPPPPPGFNAQWMVYDAPRARMLLGGYIEPGVFTFQTWELDPGPAAWTLRDPGTAPQGPAAFDVAQSRTVSLNGPAHATMECNGAATSIGAYIQQGPPWSEFPVGSTIRLSVQAGGTAPLEFQWYRNGQPLTDGGRVSGAQTDTLSIASAEYADAGGYSVRVYNGCGSVQSQTATITIVPVCYANCDNSTTPPYLNVNDFVCFLNRFAAGDSWANCDNCTCGTVLNVLDFGCFLNKFAAGCSGP